MPLKSIIALLTACLFGMTGATAQTTSKKPKPPPGRDPGGIAVAIIGSGIDYRRPEIARRLARDGEGTIIGWDLIDNDPHPLEAVSIGDQRVPLYAGTEIAQWLLREAPDARLIPVRARDADLKVLGTALNFSRSTPARVAIALLNEAPSEIPQALFELIRASPQLLVVVPSTTAGQLSQTAPASPLPNMITVSAVTEAGSRINSDRESPTTDVAAPVPDSAVLNLPTSLPGADIALANTAAIRLAALAARLLAAHPGLDAATLRKQILALARSNSPPVTSDKDAPPWLPNIDRLPTPP